MSLFWAHSSSQGGGAVHDLTQPVQPLVDLLGGGAGRGEQSDRPAQRCRIAGVAGRLCEGPGLARLRNPSTYRRLRRSASLWDAGYSVISPSITSVLTRSASSSETPDLGGGGDEQRVGSGPGQLPAGRVEEAEEVVQGAGRAGPPDSQHEQRGDG